MNGDDTKFKPTQMTELTVSEIISRIDDDKKMLIQRGVSEMSRREYEDSIGGGRLARFGAWVISVEGESWQEGMNTTEGRGRLGRFVKSEEFNEMVKITFTKPKGLFVGDSDQLLPADKRIQHPLSKDGFYVPKDGGFMTLDDGWILLVSKTGIFTGRGGWDKAREFHSKWSYEVNNNHNIMDRNQALTTQLQHTESMLMLAHASREDFQLWAIENKEKFQKAWDTLGKIRDHISSLHSQLEGMQWINAHQEQTIKETLKNLDIQARELRTYVHDDKMFDTIQQATTKIPDLSPYQKNNLMQRLKRTGVVGEDPQEKLINEQKKMIEAMQKRISELMSAPQQSAPKLPKSTQSKQNENPDEGSDEQSEDDSGIVDEVEDEEAEEQESDDGDKPDDESPKPAQEKPKDDKPKKPSLLDKLKGGGAKVKQDVAEGIGKAVAKTPKDEPPKEEPAPQEQPQQDQQAEDTEDEEGE